MDMGPLMEEFGFLKYCLEDVEHCCSIDGCFHSTSVLLFEFFSHVDSMSQG